MQLIELGIIVGIGLGVNALFRWFAKPTEPDVFTEDSIKVTEERRRMFIEQERHR